MLSAGTLAVESQLRDGTPMEENAAWKWAQGFFVQAEECLNSQVLQNQQTSDVIGKETI